MTLAHVMAWVTDLRARGWAWDSRRHALSYVRRAAMMGTRHGVPDVLGKMRIDTRDRRQVVLAWPLDRLALAIESIEDKRVRMVLVLGGCLGLRPTEILRAQVGDLEGDVLSVGLREARNDASVRALPVPATALKWLRQALGRRTTGAMVEPFGPRCGDHYTLSGLHQLTAAVLKGPPRIKPKDLRKTFASWACEVIPAVDLERFLGHRTVLHAAVTERSYLIAHQVTQLRPAARLMDATLAGAMLRLKTKAKGKRTA